jgi:hypothetical protein
VYRVLRSSGTLGSKVKGTGSHKSDRSDRVFMSIESGNLFVRIQFPYSYSLVPSAGQDPATVRRNGDTVDFAPVLVEDFRDYFHVGVIGYGGSPGALEYQVLNETLMPSATPSAFGFSGCAPNGSAIEQDWSMKNRKELGVAGLNWLT